ncbi:MAG TPA: deoxyribose-phosphate aldolase [Phycisphaerae bacterium]|nr:deoxyribose-phosphate aldolase [Phycisphaerae bacterium]
MDLAPHIDHTLLKPEATAADIHTLIQEALEHQFATVCVHGRWVALAAEILRNPHPSHTKVCAVVGFPLGAMKSSVKAIEAVAAVKDGAREIDMVISLATLFEADLDGARADVFEVCRGARAAARDTLVKVILETAALNEEQVALGCQAAREGGADFVKTSTGFHPQGGATEEAVRWLLKYGHGLKVKASGGIRDRSAAEKYLALGVARIGTSNGVAIVRGTAGQTPY